jgi:hypothetical protein
MSQRNTREIEVQVRLLPHSGSVQTDLSNAKAPLAAVILWGLEVGTNGAPRK